MLGAAEHQLAIIHDPGTQTVCQPLVDGGRIVHQPEGKRPLSINDMGELSELSGAFSGSNAGALLPLQAASNAASSSPARARASRVRIIILTSLPRFVDELLDDVRHVEARAALHWRIVLERLQMFLHEHTHRLDEP